MGTLEPWNWGTGEGEEGTFRPLALVASPIWRLSHVGEGLSVKKLAPPHRPGPRRLSEGSDVTVHLWGFLLEGSGVPPS